MVNKLRHRAGMTAAVLAVALMGAACSGNDSTSTGTGTGTTAGSGSGAAEGASGSIVISGSSTVEPISSGVAEAFREQNPNVNIKVDGPGTGDGFKLFCEGTTDISDASRQIKDEEAAACKAKGIEYVELKVGLDGITVMTSNKNTAVKGLNFGDLYALIGPEAKAKKWSDADALAKKVGGNGGFPNAPLQIFGPGEESGTYDSFIEIALKKIAEKQKADEKSTRKDYQSSPNDNQIIEGIANNDASLGWVGFAFAEENKDKVREIPIAKEGSDFVAPTPETVRDGSYPLSRALYIYVNKAKIDSNKALAPFVDYYIGDEGIKQVEEAKYVAEAPEDLAKTRETWKNRTAGAAAKK